MQQTRHTEKTICLVRPFEGEILIIHEEESTSTTDEGSVSFLRSLWYGVPSGILANVLCWLISVALPYAPALPDVLRHIVS